MKQLSKDLDQLFSLLRADFPTREIGELQKLLQTTELANNNFSSSSQFIRRNVIMIPTFLILLGVVVGYFELSQNSLNKSTLLTSSEIANPLRSREITADHDHIKVDNTEYTNNTIQYDSLKRLSFNKANVIPDLICPVSEDELAKLGIRSAEGMIILDDDYLSQLEFPIDTFARFSDHASRLEQVPFELFPHFITDSKGSLIMMSERKQAGRESKIELVADIAGTIPKRNYYRTEAMSIRIVQIDSSITPPIIINECRFSIGIMSLDTVIRYRYGFEQEKQAIIHLIQEQLVAKDSTFKASFGGEKGLISSFGNSFAQSTLSIWQRMILSNIDSIARLPLSELERTKLQASFLNQRTSSTDYSPNDRLKIEQLARTYDYKYYVLQHQTDEDTFSRINNDIPILVRPASGVLPNPTYDNGLIFWYKPSSDFYAAVRSLQATTIITNTVFDDIKIYPNPSTSILYINCMNRSVVSIELRDLLGHSVVSKTINNPSIKESIQLDVSPLTPGMYFLTMKNNRGKVEIRRVMVQRQH